MVTSSPFWRATRSFVTSIGSLPGQDEYRAAQAENERPATMAEEHALGDLVHCFRLRYGGMLVRALGGSWRWAIHPGHPRRAQKAVRGVRRLGRTR